MSRKKLINLGFGDERRDINVSYYYYNFSLTLTLLIQPLIWSPSDTGGLAALLKCRRQIRALGLRRGPRGALPGSAVLPFHPDNARPREPWCRRRGAKLLRAGWARALWGARGRSRQERGGHVPPRSPVPESWDGRAVGAGSDFPETGTEFGEGLWLA